MEGDKDVLSRGLRLPWTLTHLVLLLVTRSSMSVMLLLRLQELYARQDFRLRQKVGMLCKVTVVTRPTRSFVAFSLEVHANTQV